MDLNETVQGHREAALPTEQAGLLGHSVCVSRDTTHLYELMFLVGISEKKKKRERLEARNEIIMKL